ncbi:hypothetical protein BBJ28_00025265, partial [Nothophytophthora sp. Chile5]
PLFNLLSFRDQDERTPRPSKQETMAVTWGDVPRLICSVLLPPLGVFFQVGCNKDFAINCLLTLLGYVHWLLLTYIPGIIHAVYILIKE